MRGPSPRGFSLLSVQATLVYLPALTRYDAFLQVVSNHGHPKYTCLYRVRVHGSPVPASSGALPQGGARAGSLPQQQQQQQQSGDVK